MKNLEDRVDDSINKATWKSVFKWGAIIILLVFGWIMLSSVLGWGVEAADVAKKEFGPKAALEKYEWFKDASAQLDKKAQDIIIQDLKLKELEASYVGVSRKDWDRIDKQTYSQFSQELAGVKASYNLLAAEYNAAASKFNWKPFMGNSDMPPTQFRVLTQ